MGAITKLQAVNHCLEVTGESPVADLSGSANTDTEFAEQLLDRFRMDLQLRGTYENEFVYEAVLASAGQIVLPAADSNDDGILDAELLTQVQSANTPQLRVIANMQGGATPILYNVTDDTDQWAAGTYCIRVTRYLNWDSMSTTLQRAVMAMAARRYQMHVAGNPDTDGFLAGEERMYLAKWRAEDTRNRRTNIFLNGPEELRKFAPNNRRRRNSYDSGRFPRW